MPASAEFVATLLGNPFLARWGGVVVGWLLTYAVHSTIVLAVAWLVASRRRVGESARDVIWKAALVGGVVTATLQTTVAPAPLGGQLRLGASSKTQQEWLLRIAITEVRRAGQPGRVVVRRQDGTGWMPIVAIVWLAGAGTALLWLTFGHARVMRSLDDRSSLDGTPVAERLAALLRRAGIARPVALTCSDATASPIAMAGREICLPRRALVELDGSEQESMLAHEVAHILRRDPHWLVAARVIESIFFFQPLNRLARRRMQEAAEYLCDDWAVQRTERPVMLARCLATVAEWVGSAGGPQLRPVSAMVESHGSPFMRRVGRILGDGSERAATRPRGVLVAIACGLVVLTGAAPKVSVPSAVHAEGATAVMRRIERESSSGPHRVLGDSVIMFTLRGRASAVDSVIGALGGRARVARASRISLRYSATPPGRTPTAQPIAAPR